MSKSGRIERYRGDSYPETFTVTDSTGTAVDLTSATVRFTVKRAATDDQEDAILALSTDNGVEITDATGGEITVSFEADTMEDIDPGVYVYDLEVTLSDGTVYTVADGWFTLLADVST